MALSKQQSFSHDGRSLEVRAELLAHGWHIGGSVGDLDSLLPRLEAELAGTKTLGACIGLVGAWSQKQRSTGA